MGYEGRMTTTPSRRVRVLFDEATIATLNEALAREIREFRSPTDDETRMFYEIVIAPGYTPEGLKTLQGKSKTVSIVCGSQLEHICSLSTFTHLII